MAKQSQLVVLIQVKEYNNFRSEKPLSIQAEIIEKFKGIEKRKSITIYGDNGNQCLEYISQFKINKKYVMALSASSLKENELTKEPEPILNTDYYLSNCGLHWLAADSVNRNFFIGKVSTEKNIISRKELYQDLWKK